jgi:hypothetical protein
MKLSLFQASANLRTLANRTQPLLAAAANQGRIDD